MTFKLGSSLQQLIIYTISTIVTQHWPNFCPKNENVRHPFFAFELVSKKTSTTQIHSVHNQHESSEKTA